MTQHLSQLKEDLFHIDIRLDRIKSNLEVAAGVAMQLAEVLLDDDNGISREGYEKLRYLIDVLPVTESAKKELIDRVDATDGRWYIPGERTS